MHFHVFVQTMHFSHWPISASTQGSPFMVLTNTLRQFLSYLDDIGKGVTFLIFNFMPLMSVSRH